MEFIKKVTQRLLQVRKSGRRLLREDGLINTTDLLVATAATVVLAAGVGGTVLSTLDESRYGKAQPDAQAVGQAIVEFYTDTGKWPGQYEHSQAMDETFFLATGVNGSPDTFDLPAVANNGLDHFALNGGSAACGANSGQGFVNGTVGAAEFTAAGDAAHQLTIADATFLNLMDFLVREPDSTNYPNWDGPYVQEISTDPWDRSWITYLAPLYCSEAVSASNGAGNLGYAWHIAGGTNRTITTPMTFSNLDEFGDDAGVSFGKLTVAD